MMEQEAIEQPKEKSKKDIEAVVNIYTSFNNTIAHVTDLSGKTITKVTGGMVTKHDRLKANPTIAMFIAKKISEVMKEIGIRSLSVRIRAKTRNPAPGPGANAKGKKPSREGFKKENAIVFEAKMEESLANAVRRYMNHVPILAVDEVEISRNDSPLYDETVSHRIGLIPLKMEKSKKEGKMKASVSKEGMVYSKEFKGDIKPVFDDIPITYLNKDQELEIEAFVKIGKGVEHAKFSPGTMFYRNVVEVTVDKEFKEKIKNLYPKNEIKEKGGKIIVVDNQKTEVSDVCERISGESGKKSEIEQKEELVITVESFGQMTPEEMFKASISELEKDLGEISKKLD